MTYHDVEKNHEVEHICDIPNFKPTKNSPKLCLLTLCKLKPDRNQL